jgi:hypothetical protein
MTRIVGLATVAALFAIAAAAPTHAATRLDGKWKGVKETVPELVAAGFTRKDAQALLQHVHGTPVIDFENGVFKGLELETGRVVATGTYGLKGDVIRFVFRRGAAVRLGAPYYLKWSVYRDRLTFAVVPGRQPLLLFTLKPWDRLR